MTVRPACAACLIAAAVSVPIAAQPFVSLVPKWQVGDKFRFEMVRTRERSQKGERCAQGQRGDRLRGGGDERQQDRLRPGVDVG
jgi:hypothetical protein